MIREGVIRIVSSVFWRTTCTDSLFASRSTSLDHPRLPTPTTRSRPASLPGTNDREHATKPPNVPHHATRRRPFSAIQHRDTVFPRRLAGRAVRGVGLGGG